MAKVVRKSEEIKKIDQQIKELNEKRKLLAEKEASLTPLQWLATELHKQMCCFNHTDECDWYYDRGAWDSYARKRYFQMACKLKDALRNYKDDPSEEKILEVVKTLK